jgi:hypothetical protein
VLQAVVEMDGAHFLKLIRDCKLIGKGLAITDVDLIFAKVSSGPSLLPARLQLHL